MTYCSGFLHNFLISALNERIKQAIYQQTFLLISFKQRHLKCKRTVINNDQFGSKRIDEPKRINRVW